MVEKRNTKSKTVSGLCTDMDKISGLADDLLVKILSFLPTRVAVSTSILSKRWECLWMWLPELKFVSISDSEYEANILRHFLDRNLPLHRAPVIESFHLDFSSPFANPENVKLWVVIALSRHLRKLIIRYQPYCNKPDILPSSLYTCKSLVTLKLGGNIRLDVPRRVCLPSLKTLQLILDTFFDGVSLQRLLSICPVLEDLVVYVNYYDRDHVALLTVNVPSLQSLSLYICRNCAGLTDGLVIDTPSLKYFKLEDHGDFGHTYFIKNMPNLEDAYVNVKYPNISSLIRSITSVKHLTICSGIVYGEDFVFNQLLEHLELCLCTEVSSNLLLQLLKDSPNLRVLDIFIMNHNDFLHWEEDPPITVRECILSSFKTFNWSGFLVRRPQGIGKILRFTSWENVGRLKTATISSESDTYVFIKEFINLLFGAEHQPHANSYLIRDFGFNH